MKTRELAHFLFFQSVIIKPYQAQIFILNSNQFVCDICIVAENKITYTQFPKLLTLCSFADAHSKFSVHKTLFYKSHVNNLKQVFALFTCRPTLYTNFMTSFILVSCAIVLPSIYTSLRKIQVYSPSNHLYNQMFYIHVNIPLQYTVAMLLIHQAIKILQRYTAKTVDEMYLCSIKAKLKQ